MFWVLRRVKTGCPLSSLLFLLGLSPIIDLFLLKCDERGLSKTRVCVDDFASALKHLSVLRTQASIFRAAGLACGLFLKPVKCILVLAGIHD